VGVFSVPPPPFVIEMDESESVFPVQNWNDTDPLESATRGAVGVGSLLFPPPQAAERSATDRPSVLDAFLM
jgi:hypothetical protein